MSTGGPIFRQPIIKDRAGASHKMVRFACAGRADAKTWYVGSTPEAAYDYWASKTKAGRRHSENVGYSDSFVVKGQ